MRVLCLEDLCDQVHDLLRRLLGRAGVEGGLGVVLDAQLDGLGDLVLALAGEHEHAVAVAQVTGEVPLFGGDRRLHAAHRGQVLVQLGAIVTGEVLVRRGDAASSMYFITAGEVEIALPNQHVRLSDGTFFGEISILTGNPRSATITASSYCELLELDRQTLNRIAATHPNVRVVLQEFYKKRARHTIEGLEGGAAG